MRPAALFPRIPATSLLRSVDPLVFAVSLLVEHGLFVRTIFTLKSGGSANAHLTADTSERAVRVGTRTRTEVQRHLGDGSSTVRCPLWAHQ